MPQVAGSAAVSHCWVPGGPTGPNAGMGLAPAAPGGRPAAVGNPADRRPQHRVRWRGDDHFGGELGSDGPLHSQPKPVPVIA